jgi:hypothetical protein
LRVEQCRLTVVIRAALPRKRNALTLSLSNQGALEFGKAIGKSSPINNIPS